MYHNKGRVSRIASTNIAMEKGFVTLFSGINLSKRSFHGKIYNEES
jgi:hypothetical protein